MISFILCLYYYFFIHHLKFNRPSEIKKNGQIFVVSNEKYIATRFLMITPHAECVRVSSELNSENIRQSITNLHR